MRQSGIWVFCLAALAAGAALGQKTAEWTAERVEKRIRAWQPTERERRWEQIGWAEDIRSALRLAREHKRPVFLFTHDGHLKVGRC